MPNTSRARNSIRRCPFPPGVQVVFLGTSGSWPTPKRNVSAIAVKRGGEVLLFDCGEGTQRQLMQSAVSFMQISRIFVSHLHGDHFLGIPGLVQSMQMNDRKAPLEIFGPREVEDVLPGLVRLGHFAAQYPIAIRGLADGEVLDLGGYAVRAMEAPHPVPALSYVLEEKPRAGRFDLEKAKALGIPAGPLYRALQAGAPVTWQGRTFTPEMVLGPPRRGRKLVYTGDSLPNARLVPAAMDCDLLIHDATVDTTLQEKANLYGHSTARQAAEIAVQCRAKRLVLTHVSPRYEQPDKIVEDARAVYPEAVLAEDFLSMEIPYAD